MSQLRKPGIIKGESTIMNIQSSHLNIVKIVTTVAMNTSPIALKYLQATGVASDVNQEQRQVNLLPWSSLQ